ncbi:MAG TPA: TerB family tellurite resistance protein [Rubricoccaceae bacterium]|nr:TerB family tellurite resistance protein [Rubricoccaceae bacterium]
MITTPDTLGTLDLSGLPEPQRLCFYGALFAMAAADRAIDPVEADRVEENLDLGGLSPEARKQVLSQAIQPPPLERCLLQLKDAPEEIRRGLMLNLIDVVLADDTIEPGEHVGLHQARQILGLSHDDVAALHEAAYVAQQTGASKGLRRPIGLVRPAEA